MAEAVPCRQHPAPGSTQAWCPEEEEAEKQPQDCSRGSALRREKISRKVKLRLSRGTVGPPGSFRSPSPCKPHLDPRENSLKHHVPPLNDFVWLPLWFQVTMEVAPGSQDKGPSRCICRGLRGKEEVSREESSL